MHSWTSSSAEETRSIGKAIGEKLNTGSVVALTGDLGSGKTTLINGLVSVFGIQGSQVSSPTFSIVNAYEGQVPVYHFDFYRIDDVRELWDIGIEEYWLLPGIKLIEWAEKCPEVLPAVHYRIHLTGTGDEPRTISLSEPG
ncbi:MAG: tRNA (adenosine(37)-N6)-threonylcarbamoyltransferase complex ATPase subunit type 1 TsaE [Bacteroidetes bacterium]|nr:tRNA (adenosine(37)-N6)-threonylcarbamoyltransferase complex ATPase subunit type 1 TsaE [Bacteroidota bacterium]